MEVTTLIMGGRAAYRGPATSRATTTGPASAGITKNPTTPYIRVGLRDSEPDDYTYVNQSVGSFCRRARAVRSDAGHARWAAGEYSYFLAFRSVDLPHAC